MSKSQIRAAYKKALALVEELRAMLGPPKPQKEPISLEHCLQCHRPVHRRGLCVRHYGRFTRAVKENPDIDAEWVAKGKVLPAQKGGRKLEEDMPTKAELEEKAKTSSAEDVEDLASRIAAHSKKKPPGKGKG